MAYIPTKEDILTLKKQLAQQEANQASNASVNNVSNASSSGGYVPTKEDILALKKQLAAQEPKVEGSPLSNLARGVGAGLSEFGRGGVNLLGRIVGTSGTLPMAGAATPIPSSSPSNMPFQPISREEFGTEKILPPGHEGTASSIGEFLGGIAPTFAIPAGKLLEAPAFISKILGVSPKIAADVAKSTGIASKIGSGAAKAGRGAANIAGIAGKNAALGAALAPFYMPDSSLKESLASGAIMGGIGGPILKGVIGSGQKLGEGVNKLLRMGGTATPEQIEQAVAQAPGGRIPLGEAIGSPQLKQFQSSILAKTPFSGMAKEYKQLGEAIQKPVQNLVTDLQAPIKTTAPNDVVSFLKNKYSDAKDKSRELYGQMNNFATSIGQKINMGSFVGSAEKALKDIDRLENAVPAFRKMQQDDDFIGFLREITKTAKENPSAIGKQDFDIATLADAELNNLIDKSIKENTKRKTGILIDLRNSLRNDIESSVTNSGNPQLSSMWSRAKEHYKSEVAPLQDKDILKFIVKGQDPSTLTTTFLRQGQYDRPELAQKLLRHLDEPRRQELLSHYLTNGKENVNLNTVMNKYAKLGDETKSMLVSPQESKIFSDALESSKRLGAQREQMFMPKTGEQTASLKAQAGLLGSAMGLASTVGGPLGFALAASLLAAPKMATKAIMSPTTRNIALKAARRAEQGSKDSKITKSIPALYSTLQSSLKNGG